MIWSSWKKLGLLSRVLLSLSRSWCLSETCGVPVDQITGRNLVRVDLGEAESAIQVTSGLPQGLPEEGKGDYKPDQMLINDSRYIIAHNGRDVGLGMQKECVIVMDKQKMSEFDI